MKNVLLVLGMSVSLITAPVWSQDEEETTNASNRDVRQAAKTKKKEVENNYNPDIRKLENSIRTLQQNLEQKREEIASNERQAEEAKAQCLRNHAAQNIGTNAQANCSSATASYEQKIETLKAEISELENQIADKTKQRNDLIEARDKELQQIADQSSNARHGDVDGYNAVTDPNASRSTASTNGNGGGGGGNGGGPGGCSITSDDKLREYCTQALDTEGYADAESLVPAKNKIYPGSEEAVTCQKYWGGGKYFFDNRRSVDNDDVKKLVCYFGWDKGRSYFENWQKSKKEFDELKVACPDPLPAVWSEQVKQAPFTDCSYHVFNQVKGKKTDSEDNKKKYLSAFKKSICQFETEIKPDCLGIQAASQFSTDDVVPEKYSSFDARFTCTKIGKETPDFKSCKDLITFYNGKFAGEQAMNVGLTADKTMYQVDANAKITKESETNALVGHQVMKGSAEKSATHEKVKAGFYSTSAAAIGGFLASYVTPKNIGNRCESMTKGCEHAGMYLGDLLFKNQNVMEQFKKELADQIGKAAAAAVMAAAYDKQAKLIDDTMKAAKKFEDQPVEDLPVLVTKCQANPQLPECQNNLGVTQSDVAGPNFNFGGGQGMNSFDSGNLNGQNTGSNAINPGASANKQIDVSGDALARFDNNQGSNDLMNNVGAASTKAAGSLGGGGGGGGGGGAGGGGGGGGDAAADGAGNGNINNNVQASGLKYGAGGGYTAAKSRDGKSGNAFDDLFGKKDAGAGDGMNFRNVAGQVSGSGKNLFQLIEDRYNKVESDKRLLEYVDEAAPAAKK